MSRFLTTTALLTAILASPAAFAAGPNNDADVQTNVQEQQQIEQGLQSGQLSTGEASKLEKDEQQIDRTESQADRNGSISPAEQAKIQKEQAHEQNQLNKLESNGVTGNPNSASSQRMQADVQRNVNQQQRIEQGAQSGSLNNKEVGKLERGQAHVNGAEARAGANGHISKAEQASIQGKENHQSKRIYRKKHNAVTGQSQTTQ
jgi:hypothetical protein